MCRVWAGGRASRWWGCQLAETGDAASLMWGWPATWRRMCVSRRVASRTSSSCSGLSRSAVTSMIFTANSSPVARWTQRRTTELTPLQESDNSTSRGLLYAHFHTEWNLSTLTFTDCARHWRLIWTTGNHHRDSPWHTVALWRPQEGVVQYRAHRKAAWV
jgi:hypothetical protein